MDEKPENKDRRARRAIDRDKVVRLILRSLPVPLVPFPELYDILRDVQKSRTDLDVKVRKTSQALTEASTLVAELQAELSERVEKVGRLRAEYERYQELARVEEGKAAALIKQLEATLSRGRGSERWVALGINLIAGLVIFILGILLSPWLRKLLGVSP